MIRFACIGECIIRSGFGLLFPLVCRQDIFRHFLVQLGS